MYFFDLWTRDFLPICRVILAGRGGGSPFSIHMISSYLSPLSAECPKDRSVVRSAD